MALVILTYNDTLSQSSDGTSLYIVDATGTFNVNSRPGGYGAGQSPNNKRDYTDITYSFIRITPPDPEADEIFIYLINADAEALANPSNTTGYQITNTVIQGDSETIVDGVYTVIYYPCFSTVENVQNFTFTNGSATVTVPNDDEALESLSYILLPADGSVTANATYHYGIDSIDTTTSPVTITLDRVYTGTTGAKSSNALVFGYGVTVYAAPIYNISTGMKSKISQLAISDCTCKKTKINNLTEATTLVFGIQANMSCYNYEKAQDLIDYLTTYINASSTGGCNC